MADRSLKIGAGLVVGLMAGLAFGILLGGDQEAAPADSPATPSSDVSKLRERLAAAELELEELRKAEPPTAEQPVESRPPELASPSDEDSQIADALRKELGEDVTPEVVEDLRRRGEALRSAHLRQAEEAKRKVAEEIAQELRDVRGVKTALAEGDGLALLNFIARTGKPMPKVVADPSAFGNLFTRRLSGPVVNGAEDTGRREGFVDGTTVSFPAGVFAWRDSRMLGVRDFPKDLLVTGVGMDQTLVRLEEISARSSVRSLTFRNMTIDCNNNYMTDLRAREPVTIRLERCRVIGFDMGAGGSVMLAARRAAFYATDCRIEAGYSRTNAGFGNLFRVRDGLLVRLERCTILGPFSSIYDANNKAAYHFSDCALIDATRRPRQPAQGVVFERCTETTSEGGPVQRRKLSDINPAW